MFSPAVGYDKMLVQIALFLEFIVLRATPTELEKING